MKNVIFIMVTLFIFSSCLKETALFNASDGILTDRSNIQVYICHTTGQGEYELIEVNASSVPGHFNHGDGYPGECYDSGLYLDENCQLIDVSTDPELCGNGIDDNCDGLTDDEDVTACDCPCFEMEDILNTTNLQYYDYRITDCAGPFVGFSQDGSCNYGVSVEGALALGPDCEVCFNLTETESYACQNLIAQAQRILSLPDFCQGFASGGSDQQFINIQSIK